MAQMPTGTNIGHYEVATAPFEDGPELRYVAESQPDGMRVTVRTLTREGVGDINLSLRFTEDLRTVAAIRHESIVPVLEVGEHDGFPFAVEDSARGTNLATLLREEGPMGWGRAARLVASVAAGLEGAHARGVVHGAIRPRDILVVGSGPDERALIGGFGLGGNVLAGVDLDAAPTPGTALDYAAPEQLRDGAAVDGRTDVYSLGCVLFEAVTGSIPFAQESYPERIEGHLHGDAPAAGELQPSLGAECDRVLDRAMSKLASARYDGPTAFGEAALAFEKDRVLREWQRPHPADGAETGRGLAGAVPHGRRGHSSRSATEFVRAVRSRGAAAGAAPAKDEQEAALAHDEGPEAVFAETEPQLEGAMLEDEQASEDSEGEAAVAEGESDPQGPEAGEPPQAAVVEEEEVDAQEPEAGDQADAEATADAEEPAAIAEPAELDAGESAPNESDDESESGAELPFRPLTRKRKRAPLIAVGAAIAAMGALALGLVLANDDEGDSGAKPAAQAPAEQPPQPAQATPPPADPATPSAQAAVPSWPTGRTAYTAVIFVSTGDRAAAVRAARRARREGLRAGVLSSSKHPPLPPGRWVAFVGSRSSRAGAERDAARAQRAGLATNPYVRYIRGG